MIICDGNDLVLQVVLVPCKVLVIIINSLYYSAPSIVLLLVTFLELVPNCDSTLSFLCCMYLLFVL